MNISEIARAVRRTEAAKQRILQRVAPFIPSYALDANEVVEMSAIELARKALGMLGIKCDSGDPVQALMSYCEGRSHAVASGSAGGMDSAQTGGGGSFLDSYLTATEQ